MKKIFLEDCCDILDSMRIPITATNRKAGIYPYYGANGLQDYVDDYIFDDELVLLAEDGGHFNSKEYPIAYRVSGRCWVNNHAHVLKPKSGIDVDYLCYSLMFCDVSKMINGTTRKKLNQSAMRKILIPIVNYDEQIAIVYRLKVIENLIDNRQQQLNLLDELIKSRFIEMFGDPVTNPMDWEKLPLQNFLLKIRYGTSTPPIFSDEGFAFIRATNISSGKINKIDMKYISDSEAKKIQKCKLITGEMIIVRSGVNSGDTCVISKEYDGHYAGYDMILTFSSNINPIFLNVLLNTEYMNKIIKPLTRRAAQPHLNAQQVQDLSIISVPIELQNKFAAFVEQTEKTKSTIKKSLDELNLLKDSLMQKYFG